MTQFDDGTEILQLTQEALDLAVTACHFDREENYVGAYDYYDKCILNIDEIIGKIPHTSSQWKKLMELRGQYDDRMDQLKEMEAQRGTLSSFAFGGMGGGSSSNNSNSNNTNNSTTNSGGSSRSFMTGRKKKKSTDAEEFQFQEIFILEDFTYDESPQNLLEIPYWQLRNIARSIEMGAFLTKSLFIPKQIWQQNDVKFSGFNAKSAAFEIIINLITNEIETLYRVHDEDSMGLAEVQFYNMEEELISLRNQLAKSFPYIKEVTLSGGNSGNLEDSSSHMTAATNTTASNNSSHGVVTVNPAAATPAPVSNGGENVNQNPISSEPSYISPPVSSSSSKNKSLTHMVSAFGKSMKKYAEVGLHRLAVALPSRVSADDLTEYKNKILRLSEKSQVFVSWIRFIDGLKAGQLVGDSHLIPSVEDVDERGSFSVQQVTLPPFILEKVQLIGQSLVNITNAIRDIVCEILLRDIEYLLDRFLHHTRKAYTRMHWDQDYSGSSDN